MMKWHEQRLDKGFGRVLDITESHQLAFQFVFTELEIT